MPGVPLIACVDAAYADDAAGVACALCEGWQAEQAAQLFSRCLRSQPASYEPGSFYKRELPLLLEILGEVGLTMAAIVIDGYVWLGSDGRPGLGARLYRALDEKVPVIGVAKTAFRGDMWSVPITRGASLKPLFVTAAGIEAQDAADAVRAMHGDHRIPTMLGCVDAAARSALRRGLEG